jgi:hypothetical protein
MWKTFLPEAAAVRVMLAQRGYLRPAPQKLLPGLGG